MVANVGRTNYNNKKITCMECECSPCVCSLLQPKDHRYEYECDYLYLYLYLS